MMLGFRRRGLVLLPALLLAGPMTGCATLFHPERTLVPHHERGAVDGLVLAADIVLSLPTVFLVPIVATVGGGISGEKILEAMFWPVAFDHNNGTLYLSKSSEEEE